MLKHLPPTPSFSPGSASLLFLSLLPPPSGAGGWGMGVAVSLSHVVSAAPSFSGGRTPYTLALLQHEVPLMGDSPPQPSPM